MPKFRTKTVEVEAVQWDGESGTANEFIGEGDGVDWGYLIPELDIEIHTLERHMRCHTGDWIIKGADGKLDVCKPDIFKKAYDKVDDDGSP